MLSLLIALGGVVFASDPAFAEPSYQPTGPDRFSVTVVDYTKYNWWMMRWGGDEIVCKIVVGHEGMPTPGEVFQDCGEDIYDEWVYKGPCTEPTVYHCEVFFVTLVNT